MTSLRFVSKDKKGTYQDTFACLDNDGSCRIFYNIVKGKKKIQSYEKPLLKISDVCKIDKAPNKCILYKNDGNKQVFKRGEIFDLINN